MKMIVWLTVLLFGAGTGFAQTKRTLQTVTISTPTVQCEMCKTRLENFLVREEGVTKVQVDYKRNTTKVSFWTDRTNIENIKAAIANAGYDADDVTANEESVQRLPKCCQNPPKQTTPAKN
jgi:mercuric ion binding protein